MFVESLTKNAMEVAKERDSKQLTASDLWVSSPIHPCRPKRNFGTTVYPVLPPPPGFLPPGLIR